MTSTHYQPMAGPSRHFDPSMQPPTIPVRSPSGSFDDFQHDMGSWSNGGRHSDHGPGQIPRPSSAGDNRNGDGAKRNPLVDLIDSEKTYVEQLGLVIRRVAAAWSRKDFPPQKLDTMFRSVEAVYRANRAFGTKLKEIGPNPASPKALGDLLMRWIDDLEPAYGKYCSTFMTGFDSYSPITENALLPNILSDISDISPPTPPLTSWSLDALFILPYARLRYYRKLYARLLRNTKEGRSDHRLLLSANQKLDALVSEVEERLEVDVAEDDTADGSGESGDHSHQRQREDSWQAPVQERVSQTSSGRGSSGESYTNTSPFGSRVEESRTSAESGASNPSPPRGQTITIPGAGNAPKPTISTPTSAQTSLTDLELRIDPERTIDLFTMNPKACKLHMNPSSLPFTRYLRSSHDVTVYFTPRSTGQQIVHSRAHVFILSDLFLMAEWMDAYDKAAKAQQVAREQPERVGMGGPMPEMWLSYPPLAGKHLTVAEGSQANVLTVTIMRKETFIIHAESEVARDQIVHDLMGCIDFAANSGSRRTTNAQSPMDVRSPSSLSEHRSGESAFPPFRQPSPFSAESSPTVSPRPGEVPPPPMAGNALVSQMNSFSLEPGETVAWQGNRGPSPQPISRPPSQPEGVVSLPPRGASLSGRTRVPSGGPGMPMAIHSDPNLMPMGGFQPGQVVGAGIPRSPSGRSVQSAPRGEYEVPPMPGMPAAHGAGSHWSSGSAASFNGHPPPSRSRSAEPLRPFDPPSARLGSFPGRGPSPGVFPQGEDDDSPPMSPVEEEAATLTGPAVISAQMKCKVYLKQAHQQWKPLGSGKLKLYAQAHGNVKQLVVESDHSGKAMLISTIVLTDGVERVAKTGVAVEISDKGKRTGIVYMIQLRNENSAAGLFESLLAGSDRTTGR